jgi:hypothetical protein
MEAISWICQYYDGEISTRNTGAACAILFKPFKIFLFSNPQANKLFFRGQVDIREKYSISLQKKLIEYILEKYKI